MNINISAICKTCTAITDCRIGLSNRDQSPLAFNCQTCGSPVHIVLDDKARLTTITGADILDSETVRQEFGKHENFVDLHLDFPVKFGTYEPGRTAFMEAISRIGFDNYQLHNFRLNALNEIYKKTPELRRVLRLYSKNTDLFSRLCKSQFGEEVKTQSPEDIDAALYKVIAKVFFPFSLPDGNSDDVNHYLHTIYTLTESKDKKVGFDSFIEELVSTNFLKNLQSDCLEIYPRILEAELPLRPALFLDFDDNGSYIYSPHRVSVSSFQEYRDLYKDISEILSRQLVLVAGINNLIHRNDFNLFDRTNKNAPISLDQYADTPYGLKLHFLDNSWYEISDQVADNKLRNSIAHYKTEYEEISQLITYYPRREGIKQEDGKSIHFLEFMRKILTSYRELHRLHHLVKCLNYYVQLC